MTIQNFKCFENETFRFDPHFNVVIGKNGSGKSSLLDAVAVAASSYLIKVLFGDAKQIEFSEIRKEWIDGQPREKTPVIISAQGQVHDSIISWERKAEYANRIYYETNSVLDLTGGKNLAEIFKEDVSISRKVSNGVIFPIIAFYQTDRLWGEELRVIEKINVQEDGSSSISKHQREEIDYFKQKEGILLGYDDCVRSKVSGNTFLSWYKTYEDTVNKFKQPNHILFLKVFKDAITSMVPEWTDMAYNFLEDDLIGLFKNENGDINMLPFKNLSDGYRNMIGMVADMVYRCIQLNPGLKENVLKETDGIVLIDELDLHLHPEWQRRVAGDLKRIFPKVQFITTTHSPFIIQSLKQEELLVLDKEVIIDKDPLRKSVEEIAENEMQVSGPRSKAFEEMVDIAKEYYNLIEQNDSLDAQRAKIDDAKLKLDKLRVRFDDDPAFVVMLEKELEKAEIHAAHN